MVQQQDIKDSLLGNIVSYLELASGFMVPVATLWKQFEGDLSIGGVGYDAFIEMLHQDSRFCVFDTDETVMAELADWVSPKEMEEMGYFKGPRVMLKKRVPDQDDVADMLIEKANQTFESLKQAWALRPEDDQATEDRLLKALAKAQRLQRELKILFSKAASDSASEEPSSE
ncbi:hypothetical protein JW948_12815 [bacterium]|nr:hypothetical protein [bacterium]